MKARRNGIIMRMPSRPPSTPTVMTRTTSMSKPSSISAGMVTPTPNASRLLVTVRPTVSLETALVLEHLDHARAKLRIEAVSAINRRRAPDLLFRVLESGR